MKTVAIIGGGFSGTLTAVNLARRAKDPLRIVLINHSYPLGRGVAYSTKRTEHLLNVAVRNMSAFPDQPDHFLDWLGTCSENANVPETVLREQFVPRKVYGDYLQALLFWHGKGATASHVRIDSIQAEALDVVPGSGHVAVVVEGQPTIAADKVVLATGNPLPADLPLADGKFEHPRYLTSPWAITDDQITDRHANVVLIGAGLTMIDVFLTLSSLDWQGTIYAVSRTGLLPLPHFHGIPYADFPPPDPKVGLAGLANLVEDHCKQLRNRGENPAIVVDKLRPFTQRIWQSFTVEEKTRFCRDYRTRWNVTRHRIPQSIHEKLTAAIASGKLQIIQGRISGMSNGADRIQVTVGKSSSKDDFATLEAGWVINCTGPQENFKTSKAALYQNLFDRGLIQADELNMGIKTEPNFRVIDGGGYTSKFLFALGPMLKGSLWETTAVPELRIQALCVAETILASLEGKALPEWFAEMWVEVVEYVI